MNNKEAKVKESEKIPNPSPINNEKQTSTPKSNEDLYLNSKKDFKPNNMFFNSTST